METTTNQRDANLDLRAWGGRRLLGVLCVYWWDAEENPSPLHCSGVVLCVFFFSWNLKNKGKQEVKEKNRGAGSKLN